MEKCPSDEKLAVYKWQDKTVCKELILYEDDGNGRRKPKDFRDLVSARDRCTSEGDKCTGVFDDSGAFYLCGGGEYEYFRYSGSYAKSYIDPKL